MKQSIEVTLERIQLFEDILHNITIPEGRDFLDIIQEIQESKQGLYQPGTLTKHFGLEINSSGRRFDDEDESIPFFGEIKNWAAMTAVGRLWVKNRDKSDKKRYFGSGFLISKDLMITNHHVVRNSTDALNTEVWLGYKYENEYKKYDCVEFICTSGDVLDYSVIRLDPPPGETFPPVISPFHPEAHLHWPKWITHFDPMGKFYPISLLGYSEDYIRENIDSLILVSHPHGGPIKKDCTHSYVKDIDEDTIEYEADSQPGSSGGAVLDYRGNIVALHNLNLGMVNGGVRIKRIHNKLNKQIDYDGLISVD